MLFNSVRIDSDGLSDVSLYSSPRKVLEQYIKVRSSKTLFTNHCSSENT